MHGGAKPPMHGNVSIVSMHGGAKPPMHGNVSIFEYHVFWV